MVDDENEMPVKRLEANAGVFDFSNVPEFPREYLRTYYCQPPTEDERVVLAFMKKCLPLIGTVELAIEVGCGPTLHHALALSPHTKALHLSDYMEANLAEVRTWLLETNDAHDWSAYAKLCLTLEGKHDDHDAIRNLQQSTRSKVTQLLQVDLKSDLPLPKSATYPLVACFYVTEEVGISKEEWRKVMHRLCSLVAPGGYLLLSALAETDFYAVHASDGTIQHYPCARISASDFPELLTSLGFRQDNMIVETTSVEGQEHDGVNGVVMIMAQKKIEA